MTIIRKHYDPPVEFHKAMPGAHKLVIMKRIDDRNSVRRDLGLVNARNAQEPARNAQPMNGNVNEPISDCAEERWQQSLTKGNNMTNEIDRGPFAKMLDKQAYRRIV
jgi:hypothetical protein